MVEVTFNVAAAAMVNGEASVPPDQFMMPLMVIRPVPAVLPPALLNSKVDARLIGILMFSVEFI